MSVQVEKLEKSMVKLTIEVPAGEFEAAVNQAYQKSKSKIAIPGFRKGKVPRIMIERMYGAKIFYEDAANIIIPDAYEKAAKESGLTIVAQPEFAVKKAEKGQPFIFTATVAVKPEVTLGEYKGIQAEKKAIEVTEDELNAEIDRVREANSRMLTIDNRATQDGDTVVIDFDGSVDGEPFEGGKAEDYPLVLGSGTFVDTFEEQLIGKDIGDEAEVHITFPDHYNAEELRGKPAVFQVKIKEIKIKELPELDDDFAQDVSDCDTLEEYKEDTREKIFNAKENAAKRDREDAIIGKIIENATMEIPEQMVQAQVRMMVQELAQNLQAQGLSVEQYMQLTGTTRQRLLDEFEPQALARIQSRLVLEAIVEAENIEASEEETEKEIENMATAYKMETDKLKDLMSEDEKKQVMMDIAVQKAVEFVVEAATE